MEEENKITEEQTAQSSSASADDIASSKRKKGGSKADCKQLEVDELKAPLKAKPKSKSGKIWTILFILLNVAVIAYTAIADFSNEATPDTPTALKVISENWYYLIFAIIAFTAGIVLEAGKLSFMMHRTTGKGRFKLCFQTMILGKYYDGVTPLASGGQPFQIYHLSKNGVKTGKATSIIITSFFLNQLTFTILCIVACVLDSVGVLNCAEIFAAEGSAMRGNFEILRIFSYVGIALGAIVPLSVLLFFVFPSGSIKLMKGGIALLSKLRIIKNKEIATMKTIRTTAQSSRSIKEIAGSFWTLVPSLLFSIALNCAACSVTYFTLRFFGFDIPNVNGIHEWLLIAQLHLFISSAVSMVPTPGTSGAADFTFYSAFNELILVPGLSFTAMITWRFLSYYIYILIGLVTLAYVSLKKKHLAKKAQ